MNAKTLKTVSSYVAGWCALVAFVLLLTFIFSFLGTIFCSVLAGMMLGAMKPHRWYSVPISLLFPVAISLILRVMKTELSGLQINLVSLLCLGAFWLAFFLTAVLVSAEQKAQTAPVPRPGPPDPAAAPRERQPVDERASPQRWMAAPREAVCPESADGLTLARLQGAWWRNAATGNGGVYETVLEIKGRDLVLKEVDGAGQVHWAAEGTVRLELAGPVPLVVVQSPPLSSAIAGRQVRSSRPLEPAPRPLSGLPPPARQCALGDLLFCGVVPPSNGSCPFRRQVAALAAISSL
jgi:hypothetical protein